MEVTYILNLKKSIQNEEMNLPRNTYKKRNLFEMNGILFMGWMSSASPKPVRNIITSIGNLLLKTVETSLV